MIYRARRKLFITTFDSGEAEDAGGFALIEAASRFPAYHE